MNRIRQIETLGQSIWYDYIQRSLIWTGELHRMMEEDGLGGVTSNPSIFEKAIGGSRDYEAALRALVRAGASAHEAFETLAIEDIRLACDVLAKVHEETRGKDGYVSLEVSPHLAFDTVATIEEARSPSVAMRCAIGESGAVAESSSIMHWPAATCAITMLRAGCGISLTTRRPRASGPPSP